MDLTLVCITDAHPCKLPFNKGRQFGAFITCHFKLFLIWTYPQKSPTHLAMRKLSKTSVHPTILHDEVRVSIFNHFLFLFFPVPCCQLIILLLHCFQRLGSGQSSLMYLLTTVYRKKISMILQFISCLLYIIWTKFSFPLWLNYSLLSCLYKK